MATFDGTERDFSCPICMELFVDPNTPKNLPCGHVCCEVCLLNMVAMAIAKTCPECRKVIIIPRGGVTKLPTNFRLRNLAEKDKEKSKSIKKSGVPICPDHEDEKMHLFCTFCNTLACHICQTLKHKGDEHEIVGYKEKYAKQMVEMQNTISEVSDNIDDGEKILQELDELRTKVYITQLSTEKQIDDCYESLLKKLTEQRQKLKKELKEATDAKLANVTQKHAHMNEKVESAKQSTQTALLAVENTPDYKYIQQHTTLIETMNQIDLNAKKPVGITGFPAAQFAPNKLNVNMTLGSILPVVPDRVRKIKLMQTIEGFKDASYVACSSHGLLAVSDFDRTQVIIYDKVQGKYERKLNLNLNPTNGNPLYEVAIHPDGRYFVARGSCIEVYSPEGNYLHNIETADGGTHGIGSITTTTNGRILAGDRKRSVITEHDATGNIIRTMKTNTCTWYMAVIHDSHIAISDWKAGKVSVIDMESEQEALSIDIPMVSGVCYDEQTECLLITRSEEASEPGKVYINTGVIEQYSYIKGKLVTCLQQGLYHPLGLSLTGDGHVIVANGHTVIIYEIK